MQMAVNDVDAVGITLLRILTQLRDAQARGKGMEEEAGWLCELRSRSGVPLEWWSLEDDGDGAGCWTADAGKALRFARKVDAEKYIEEAGWTNIVATEHIWQPARAALSRPEGSAS